MPSEKSKHGPTGRFRAGQLCSAAVQIITSPVSHQTASTQYAISTRLAGSRWIALPKLTLSFLSISTKLAMQAPSTSRHRMVAEKMKVRK